MYQKDYILQMIVLLMKFIGEVLGLIRKGELNMASEQLEQSYNSFLREDAVFFRNIPEDRLINKLLQEHNYTSGHIEILAELFNAEALLRLAHNDRPGCHEYSVKSLILFEYVDKAYKIYSEERFKKMEQIRIRITELD